MEVASGRPVNRPKRRGVGEALPAFDVAAGTGVPFQIDEHADPHRPDVSRSPCGRQEDRRPGRRSLGSVEIHELAPNGAEARASRTLPADG